MIDFEKVIEENHAIIFKICKVYATNSNFDDLYQEMLIAIWKGLKNFKGNSKMSTWLYKVVLNTALTYQKKEKRQLFNKVELREADKRQEEELPPKNNQEKLYYAIQKLRPEDRSIILLYFEEKTHDEIADIMGITNGNVRVKLSRIKNKLSEIIKQIAK